MERKVRFPLKLKNGTEARTIEELQANFDLESVLSYFVEGKLYTWFADRYYIDKAKAVNALSADTPDLNQKLCDILGVEYQKTVNIWTFFAFQQFDISSSTSKKVTYPKIEMHTKNTQFHAIIILR